jgi:hypothetical protein
MFSVYWFKQDRKACRRALSQRRSISRRIRSPSILTACGWPALSRCAARGARYRMLHQRISVFTALPLRSLDQLSLQARLREIGLMSGATAKAVEPS